MPADRTTAQYSERRYKAQLDAAAKYRQTDKGKVRREKELAKARAQTALLKEIKNNPEAEATMDEKAVREARTAKAKVSERMKRFAQTEKGRTAQQKNADSKRQRRAGAQLGGPQQSISDAGKRDTLLKANHIGVETPEPSLEGTAAGEQ